MSKYFLKPKSLRAIVKVEADWSNSATKEDLKDATDVDTWKFAKKMGLAKLKSEVDKLHIDKLEKVPTGLNSLKSKKDKKELDKIVTVRVYLNKLNDVVKYDVVENTEYDELLNKVNIIQTTDCSNLVKKTDYNTKINEIEKQITDHHHEKYITT